MSAKLTLNASLQGQSGSFTFGNTSVFTAPDSGNGNLLLASSTPLSAPGTVQSLCFYARTAGGNLRLGVYSDASGKPGSLLASTAQITPIVGWNTAAVTSPLALNAGTYWLAYLPSSSSLGLWKAQVTGGSKWVKYAYGAMPATFPTSGVTSDPYQWSFYGTLSSSTTPPTPTKPTYTKWDTRLQAFILTGAAPAQSPAQVSAWISTNPPTAD